MGRMGWETTIFLRLYKLKCEIDNYLRNEFQLQRFTPANALLKKYGYKLQHFTPANTFHKKYGYKLQHFTPANALLKIMPARSIAVHILIHWSSFLIFAISIYPSRWNRRTICIFICTHTSIVYNCKASMRKWLSLKIVEISKKRNLEMLILYYSILSRYHFIILNTKYRKNPFESIHNLKSNFTRAKFAILLRKL